MTKRIPTFHLEEDYADSVSLWRYAGLVIFFGFLAVLGVSFVYLRFKVRDLKIAINATEERIDKLRERENAIHAAMQTRAHQWTLKQTAVQQLGMVDFNPRQILHMEYPSVLLAEYGEAARRYQMDRAPADEGDPIRMMLNRFTPPAAADAGTGGSGGAGAPTGAVAVARP